MHKRALRKLYLQKRAALTEEQYQARNERIFTQFFKAFSFPIPTVVHCFLPSTRQREVNTYPIIRQLQTLDNVQIIVPRCASSQTLTHHRLTPDTTLVPNRWGIPEPTDNLFVSPQQIDLVLTPLLAFDQRGYRVGYGKGFYDRFLAQCRPDMQKIGLSWEPPVPAIDDVDDYDVALDGCVMPDGVWWLEDKPS